MNKIPQNQMPLQPPTYSMGGSKKPQTPVSKDGFRGVLRKEMAIIVTEGGYLPSIDGSIIAETADTSFYPSTHKIKKSGGRRDDVVVKGECNKGVTKLDDSVDKDWYTSFEFSTESQKAVLRIYDGLERLRLELIDFDGNIKDGRREADVIRETNYPHGEPVHVDRVRSKDYEKDQYGFSYADQILNNAERRVLGYFFNKQSLVRLNLNPKFNTTQRDRPLVP